MSQRWTIDQLTTVVQKALETGKYDGQQSARVRSVPDLRTIRYYTTLGILSPPIEMRGRRAFYDRTHLLQLVAVKRLQTRGLTLVEVQEALTGADEQTLERLAALPVDFWQQMAESPHAASDAGVAQRANSSKCAPAESADRECFWGAAPAVTFPPEELRQTWQTQPAVHLMVADGVELVFEGIDPARLDPAALVRLSPALRNLAESLREIGLVPNRTGGPQSSHQPSF
jgi:DNA-binding transcriptional MerR regulator